MSKKGRNGTLQEACELVRRVGLGSVLAALTPKARSEKELLTVEAAVQKVRETRQRGKTVAFTSGCCDILHIGHILFFGDCKDGADLLIVGVDSNQNITAAKGAGHPMFDETERVLVVASLACVDHVLKFDGPCAKLLERLKPDFYCFSPYDPVYDRKAADARRAGARVKEAGYSLKAWSSSRVAGSIRMSYLLPGRWND
ncbi:MAG: adenylyltransferase/cytidyltransferase family protein [Candidatus Peregrinibacteria bacterium]